MDQVFWRSMKDQNKFELLIDGSINLRVLAGMLKVNYYTLWRACSGKQVGTAALAKKIAKWGGCQPVDVIEWWQACIYDRIKNEIAKL